MGSEKWIAATGVALYVMFVGEILTVFDFLIDPVREIDPDAKILQFISIGVVPAMILTAVSFLMSRRYGSKQVGMMIIGGGIILLVGMGIAFTMIDRVDKTQLVDSVIIVPPLFMVVSIPIMFVGALLFRIKKRPKKEYF